VKPRRLSGPSQAAFGRDDAQDDEVDNSALVTSPAFVFRTSRRRGGAGLFVSLGFTHSLRMPEILFGEFGLADSIVGLGSAFVHVGGHWQLLDGGREIMDGAVPILHCKVCFSAPEEIDGPVGGELECSIEIIERVLRIAHC
jgi:hypothetical protein